MYQTNTDKHFINVINTYCFHITAIHSILSHACSVLFDIWSLDEDLKTVLQSSDCACACYDTCRRGYGSLNRGGAVE
jgi:hypothetical protein